MEELASEMAKERSSIPEVDAEVVTIGKQTRIQIGLAIVILGFMGYGSSQFYGFDKRLSIMERHTASIDLTMQKIDAKLDNTASIRRVQELIDLALAEIRNRQLSIERRVAQIEEELREARKEER